MDSGKSTLSLALLLWENANFISDDITLMYSNKNEINITGLFNGLNINSNEVNNLRICRKADIYNHSDHKKRLTINKEYTVGDSIVNYIVFPKTNEGKSIIKKIPAKKGINNLNKYIMSNQKDGVNADLLSKMNFNNVIFYEMRNDNDIRKNIIMLLNEINKN